jgi:serine/threonine protein kinase
MSCSPRLSSEKNYKEKYLARGSNGAVFKIKYIDDQTGLKKKFALKKVEMKNIFNDLIRKEKLEDAQKEYKILKLGIPNVLKAYGSCYDQKKVEYRFSSDLMHKNLAEFVMERGPLDLQTFIPIFTDIIRGNIFFSKKQSIHSFSIIFFKGTMGLFSQKEPIIHRDLKPENILISKVIFFFFTIN